MRGARRSAAPASDAAVPRRGLRAALDRSALPALLSLAACSSPVPPGEPGPGAPLSTAPPARPSGASMAASASASAGSAAAPASAGAPDAGSAPPRPAIAIALDEAEDVLFPGATAQTLRQACPDTSLAAAEQIRCLIAARFRGDDEARAIALDLFERTGGVAGVEREHVMDGGFRGKLHLVPEPPVGPHRKHLAWVAAATTDFEWFFGELEARAGKRPAYRHEPIAWRFFRSVGRTTPSAYASGWTVAYNVSGSLLRTADGTRETLFHEIFHLNDGEQRFSRPKLGAIYDGIVARCGARTPCLAPYAPTTTMVRGGTYYAFQPDNGDGVHEYAAEIAMRYYQDHRALLRGERLTRPAFKCGPPENAEAWSRIVEAFFGGVDLTPPC